MIMRFLRTLLRFFVAIQLLPALEGGEETLVGGQAVLEGVMMRSPHAWAIACRKPSGVVSTHSEPLERLSDKHKWMGWPVVRGVITLGHAMTLGFRALKFSANVALDELQPESEPGQPEKKKLEINGWIAAVNIVFSVGFFIFMYKFLPLVATTELKRVNPFFAEQIIFNLVDGIIRLALFLLFIWGTSLWKDIRRVYEYHGAEHKTVFAFETHRRASQQGFQASAVAGQIAPMDAVHPVVARVQLFGGQAQHRAQPWRVVDGVLGQVPVVHALVDRPHREVIALLGRQRSQTGRVVHGINFRRPRNPPI